jgi:hypothetical protein
MLVTGSYYNITILLLYIYQRCAASSVRVAVDQPGARSCTGTLLELGVERLEAFSHTSSEGGVK